MKVSRSYLLGLGSGLILSALLAMVIPSVGINFAGGLAPAQVAPDPNPQGSETPANSGTDENATQDSDLNSESPSSNAEKEQSNLDDESNTQIKKTLVIPRGSTADRIANLLLAEGWIASKEEFLDLVKKENLASRFRAGSFELTEGMSNQEILEQLIR